MATSKKHSISDGLVAFGAPIAVAGVNVSTKPRRQSQARLAETDYNAEVRPLPIIFAKGGRKTI